MEKLINCLLLVVCFVTAVNGTDIRFNSSLTSIKPPLSKDLSLHCSLRDTGDVEMITSIVIAKHETEVARITVLDPATSLINSPDLEVKGQLTNQPGEWGFLELTWKLPTSSESGKYRCVAQSMSVGLGRRSSLHFSKTLEVGEEEVSLVELIRYVQEGDRERDRLKMSERKMNLTIAELKKENQNNRAVIDGE